MVRRLPPLNALRAFEAAARHLSFAKAAVELHVTAAAISHQIKGLEDDLGTKLFRRATRAVVLTEAGQALLPPLRDGFDRIAAGVTALQALDRRGILTVSSAPSFAARWLVPRLGLFHARHPDIDVRVSATMALVDFARDGVDLAIRYGRGKYPGLHVERLMRDEMFPVLSPALRRRGPKLRKPDDLRHFTLLHDESPIATPDWTMWLKAAGATQVDPSRGTRFNSFDLILTAAIAGEGVALARSSLAATELSAGRLVQPFSLRLSTDLATYFVCPPAALKSQRVAAFKDWLFEEIAKLDARNGETRLTS
jgi:LysR family transcriptional regulator, glycine cleavage system transcriptional activator